MKATKSQQITRGPETRNLPEGDCGDMGMVAKRLALMDVRQMNFDRGQPDCRDGIAYRDACMRIRGRIDDNTVVSGCTFLNPVHEFTFHIRLPDIDFHGEVVGQLGQGRIEAVQGLGPIDRLLSGSQQIQIGSVQDEYAEH